MSKKPKPLAKAVAKPVAKAVAKAIAKTAPKAEKPNDRPIADNRKARHKYAVIETLECGLALTGSEVKSLHNGKVSLDEAYARVKDNEAWLIGCDIPIYAQATIWNHEPTRPRKLLLHRREVLKFAGLAHEKGLTLVPLKMYFNARGRAKVLIGLCRGKKLHDKREDMKKKDTQRDMDRAMRRG